MTVQRSGNGSGKVTSSPAGISCPKTCSHKFAYGTLGDPEGEGLQGLRLRRLVGRGRVRPEDHLQDQGQRDLAVTAMFTLKNCVVPNVKGKTLSTAKLALKLHACSAGKIKHAFSNSVKTGRVISQSPQAGSHLQHNGKVSLTVSEGPKH